MGVDKGKSIPVILDDRSMQFRWLDRVVYPSQQFTLDYVSRKHVVRLQFNTEEGFNSAKGGDLNGVYLCDRFFDKDFTERSRRSLLWSNLDPSTLLKYQDFSGQRFVEKTVELRLWLPHRVAEKEGLFTMFKKSERYKQIQESPTDLGRLLKGFQEFIDDAGWKEETINYEIRNRDVRGKFAAKYEWVVPCEPPDHLYQINWIAELEDQDDQQRNAVGLRNVRLLKKHSHIHKKCLVQISKIPTQKKPSAVTVTEVQKHQEIEALKQSMVDSLLGNVPISKTVKGIDPQKLRRYFDGAAVEVIAELGWGDGVMNSKKRRMECMNIYYNQRKKIVSFVLIHLCGFGESRDKLASKCNVPMSAFKRLIKKIRNTQAGKNCQKNLTRFADNPFNIPKHEDEMESAWSSQVNKMI